MITPEQIGTALGLTGVSLTVGEAGLLDIAADQPVSVAMLKTAQGWWASGQIVTGPTAQSAYAAGHTVSGYTYAIDPEAQHSWTASLTVLREAQLAGSIDDATPVDAVLGPVLDLAGNAVPSMTVAAFRLLLLTQLLPRVAQIRSGNF
jgi:hypothetical protein